MCTRMWPLLRWGGGRGMYIYMYPGGSTSLSVSDPVKTRYMYGRYTVLILKLSVLSCGPSLHISYSSVSMRSLSIIVRCTWLCGQCPAHLRFTRWLSGRSPVACQVHRSKTGCERTGNARVPTKTHAQRTITVQPADAFGRWCPFQVLSMHKTFHWIERTSPDKERIHRTTNGQQTNANGHERIAKFAVRWTTVNAIR